MYAHRRYSDDALNDPCILIIYFFIYFLLVFVCAPAAFLANLLAENLLPDQQFPQILF